MQTYELNVSSLEGNKEMGKERGKFLLSVKKSILIFTSICIIISSERIQLVAVIFSLKM